MTKDRYWNRFRWLCGIFGKFLGIFGRGMVEMRIPVCTEIDFSIKNMVE